MKRCNHKFCSLVADAACKTCWLEAEDIPDPIRLLRLIVRDPASAALPGSVLVEAQRFLRKFEEIDSPVLSGEGPPAELDDNTEVTDIYNISSLLSLSTGEYYTQSGEGEA